MKIPADQEDCWDWIAGLMLKFLIGLGLAATALGVSLYFFLTHYDIKIQPRTQPAADTTPCGSCQVQQPKEKQ